MFFALCLGMSIAQAGNPGDVPLTERMLDSDYDEYGACTGTQESWDGNSTQSRSWKVTWVYKTSDKKLVVKIKQLGSGKEPITKVGAVYSRDSGGIRIEWVDQGETSYIEKYAKNGDLNKSCKGEVRIVSEKFTDYKAYCVVADSFANLKKIETETCPKSCVEGAKSCLCC
jgi:hypothetical protein